jgi:hypothetical protein
VREVFFTYLPFSIFRGSITIITAGKYVLLFGKNYEKTSKHLQGQRYSLWFIALNLFKYLKTNHKTVSYE